MRRRIRIRLASLAAAALILSLPAAPAMASVPVPAGTAVGLKLLETLDSQQISQGASVHFAVAADVIVGRYVVIRAGTSVTGTATQVSRPGMYGNGTGSRVIIGSLTVAAADGTPLALQDLNINAGIKYTVAGEAGPSIPGAVFLFPIGFVSGAALYNGPLQIPAGSVVTTATGNDARVGVQ